MWCLDRLSLNDVEAPLKVDQPLFPVLPCFFFVRLFHYSFFLILLYAGFIPSFCFQVFMLSFIFFSVWIVCDLSFYYLCNEVSSCKFVY